MSISSMGMAACVTVSDAFLGHLEPGYQHERWAAFGRGVEDPLY